MFDFFYSLFLSLFLGEWTPNSISPIDKVVNSLSSLLVNAFGGDFQALQNFNFLNGFTAIEATSSILALVVMCLICFAVWKLVKSLFSLFFNW